MKKRLIQFWNWLYYAKGGSPYASFERRMLASMIDTLLIMIIILPLIKPFMTVVQPATEYIHALTAKLQQGSLSTLDYNTQIFDYMLGEGGRLLLLDLTYQTIFMGVVVVLFWIYRSATPGKMILNMEIVDAKTGEKPTRKQCIIRYVGYIVAVLPLIVSCPRAEAALAAPLEVPLALPPPVLVTFPARASACCRHSDLPSPGSARAREARSAAVC
jgi:uncharacterized RDD family membrane protein YckC